MKSSFFEWTTDKSSARLRIKVIASINKIINERRGFATDAQRYEESWDYLWQL